MSAPQGTDEWLSERMGKATASRMSDIMAKGRGGAPSATRKTYLSQLVLERLTGKPMATFKSEAMQNGTDTEEQARASYMLATFGDVQEVGFIEHPKIPMSGCSPDGLIGDDGGLELKCPQPAKHISTLMGGNIDRPYMLQMQWSMACTGREWWDFASFNPDFPDEMRLHVRRVPAEPELIAELEEAVASFLVEVASAVNGLRQQYQGAA